MHHTGEELPSECEWWLKTAESSHNIIVSLELEVEPELKSKIYDMRADDMRIYCIALTCQLWKFVFCDFDEILGLGFGKWQQHDIVN